MTYIFDSSAIYSLISRRDYSHFAEGFTIYLAKYEYSNILWKEFYLHKRLGTAQKKEMAEIAEKVFANIEVVGITGYIDNVINLGAKLGISFYDASYAFFAMKRNAVLVTVDEKLTKKLKGSIINTVSPEELLK
jgi:predicted nucleic acid-binding protein